MSKLAVYEKNDARKDLRKMSYYRHDYVYKRNMGLRLCFAMGSFIIIIFYMLHKFAIEEADIFALDIAAEAMTVVSIIVAMLLISSLLGTVKYNLEYEQATKRMKRYQTLLGLLEKGGAVKK